MAGLNIHLLCSCYNISVSDVLIVHLFERINNLSPETLVAMVPGYFLSCRQDRYVYISIETRGSMNKIEGSMLSSVFVSRGAVLPKSNLHLSGLPLLALLLSLVLLMFLSLVQPILSG